MTKEQKQLLENWKQKLIEHDGSISSKTQRKYIFLVEELLAAQRAKDAEILQEYINANKENGFGPGNLINIQQKILNQEV